jgi:hypothetical protein
MGTNPFGPELTKVIQIKAKKYFSHPKDRAYQAEDAEQDVKVHILANRSQLTARTASEKTVMDRVIRNKLLNLIDAQRAQRRDRRRDISVDDAPALLDAETGLDVLITRMDIHTAIASLPEDLRQMATLLMQTTPTDAQRQLNVTRGKVRNMMLRIAQHFKDCGIPGTSNQLDRESCQ